MSRVCAAWSNSLTPDRPIIRSTLMVSLCVLLLITSVSIAPGGLLERRRHALPNGLLANVSVQRNVSSAVLLSDAPSPLRRPLEPARVWRQRYCQHCTATNAACAVIMPQSALETLSRLHIMYPMMFRVTSDAPSTRSTHCGVLEFCAPEGILYMPDWMMRTLGVKAGALLTMENVSLPLGRYWHCCTSILTAACCAGL